MVINHGRIREAVSPYYMRKMLSLGRLIVRTVVFVGHSTSPMAQQSYPLVHLPPTLSCCLHSPEGFHCSVAIVLHRDRALGSIARLEEIEGGFTPVVAPSCPTVRSYPLPDPLQGCSVPWPVRRQCKAPSPGSKRQKAGLLWPPCSTAIAPPGRSFCATGEL